MMWINFVQIIAWSIMSVDILINNRTDNTILLFGAILIILLNQIELLCFKFDAKKALQTDKKVK